MPFALRWMGTGQLLACEQVNGYEMRYFGVVLWDMPPEAARISEALAMAGVAPEHALGSLPDWEPVELSEHQAKMANVKLRNDPRRAVFYREGSLHAQ